MHLNIQNKNIYAYKRENPRNMHLCKIKLVSFGHKNCDRQSSAFTFSICQVNKKMQLHDVPWPNDDGCYV